MTSEARLFTLRGCLRHCAGTGDHAPSPKHTTAFHPPFHLLILFFSLLLPPVIHHHLFISRHFLFSDVSLLSSLLLYYILYPFTFCSSFTITGPFHFLYFVPSPFTSSHYFDHYPFFCLPPAHLYIHFPHPLRICISFITSSPFLHPLYHRLLFHLSISLNIPL